MPSFRNVVATCPECRQAALLNGGGGGAVGGPDDPAGVWGAIGACPYCGWLAYPLFIPKQLNIY